MARKYKIAILPGDGIGPEVTSEAVKVLTALCYDLEFLFADVGSKAYNETGNPVPLETREICDEADAVLLGAIGHSYAPYGIPGEVPIYLRIEKSAYANVCPLKLYDGVYPAGDPRANSDIDIVVVKDNLGGFALVHEGSLWEGRAIDKRVITVEGARRIAEFACRYALDNGRGKITCIDAHNLLYGDKLFRSAFKGVSENYPSIQDEFISINVASMMLAGDFQQFDVILTHDIYGDILSWHIIGEIGGIGLAPSANIGDDFAVFQPMGGAAWKISGRGVANPIGSILSAKMMLDWIGKKDEARSVEEGVSRVLLEGRIRTPDLGGNSNTKEVGDAIVTQINQSQGSVERPMHSEQPLL
jgi:3-isopropylmalate dehydrogenase